VKVSSGILGATVLMAIVVPPAAADDQTLPGAGKATAAALATKSPMVNSACDNTRTDKKAFLSLRCRRTINTVRLAG